MATSDQRTGESACSTLALRRVASLPDGSLNGVGLALVSGGRMRRQLRSAAFQLIEEQSRRERIGAIPLASLDAGLDFLD